MQNGINALEKLEKDPLQCEVCLKYFSSKNNKKRHEMIHSGEKPFQCALCDRSFARKDHIQDHMERTHAAPSEIFGD